MQAVLFSFSNRGGQLSIAVGKFLEVLGYEAECYTLPKFADADESLIATSDYKAVCAEAFATADVLVFVGAAGIAVRTIAPFVKSKTTDPAVLVIDEQANFVISLLSGHIGGANVLARKIADEIEAQPVVTTATDVNSLFAVDEWATNHDMVIGDMHAAKEFAAALVDGKTVGFYSDYPLAGALPKNVERAENGEIGVAITTDSTKKPFDTTLTLIPQIVHLGIGCRRDTPFEKLEAFVLSQLEEHGYDLRSVKNIASVNLKMNERCLMLFMDEYNLPGVFYSAEELQEAQGDFTPSEFVKSVAGVDNVCERAAVLASGGKLTVKKIAHNGMTLAIAEEPLTIDFEN